jgi:hypothetical protein
MLSILDEYQAPPLERSLAIAAREVTELVCELEPTLTDHQRSLLHQLRLAAESLGAVRASLALRAR